MQHVVDRVFWRNQEARQQRVISMQMRCGAVMHASLPKCVPAPTEGQVVNSTNQRPGPCPHCLPDLVSDPTGAAPLEGVGASSFLGSSPGIEETQEGDILGGYTREGEDVVAEDGRLGRVAVRSGAPIIATEINHGMDRLGDLGSTDGLGRYTCEDE